MDSEQNFISFSALLEKLVYISNIEYRNKFFLNMYEKYIVINFPDRLEHITIFKDQWDQYSMQTKLPYHLFHVTSTTDTTKCSTYFWVNIYAHQIKKIPSKYFKYEAPEFSFNASTRPSCEYKLIKSSLKKFQQLLSNIH